jgi:hypothetical protein
LGVTSTGSYQVNQFLKETNDERKDHLIAWGFHELNKTDSFVKLAINKFRDVAFKFSYNVEVTLCYELTIDSPEIVPNWYRMLAHMVGNDPVQDGRLRQFRRNVALGEKESKLTPPNYHPNQLYSISPYGAEQIRNKVRNYVKKNGKFKGFTDLETRRMLLDTANNFTEATGNVTLAFQLTIPFCQAITSATVAVGRGVLTYRAVELAELTARTNAALNGAMDTRAVSDPIRRVILGIALPLTFMWGLTLSMVHFVMSKTFKDAKDAYKAYTEWVAYSISNALSGLAIGALFASALKSRVGNYCRDNLGNFFAASDAGISLASFVTLWSRWHERSDAEKGIITATGTAAAIGVVWNRSKAWFPNVTQKLINAFPTETKYLATATIAAVATFLFTQGAYKLAIRQ